MRDIQFHHVISGSDTKGWIHTHGMDRLGLPESEIRSVQAFLAEVGCDKCGVLERRVS